jgi:hypothetical protein
LGIGIQIIPRDNQMRRRKMFKPIKSKCLVKNSIFVDSKSFFFFGKILDLSSVVTEKMLVKRIEM